MMIPGFGFDSIITIQRQLDLISILRRIITLASIISLRFLSRSF
jgi:hypothetical protein